jgi:hypothetical protein
LALDAMLASAGPFDEGRPAVSVDRHALNTAAKHMGYDGVSGLMMRGDVGAHMHRLAL